NKALPPRNRELMGKKRSTKENGVYHIEGLNSGYQPFVSLCIKQAVEQTNTGTQNQIPHVLI
uniref:Uncharacterized protein n=1 Tax=Callithrix jacchus TaxID=9483 RepID=A0A8I3X2M1_CALJA